MGLKNLMRKMKQGIAAGLIAMSAVFPAKAEETQSKAETSININSGYIDNNLMGDDFSRGNYTEAKCKGRINLSEKGFIAAETTAKLENLVFERGGKVFSFDNEAKILLVRKDNDKSPYASFGANLDISLSTQKFQGINASLENINAGPSIAFGIDSKHFDLGIEYDFGIGKAGNSVHGTDIVMKHKIKAETAIDFKPLRLEGYFEGKANVLNIKNVDRNDYHFSAGAEARLSITSFISLTAGYEHRRVYGNHDNVQTNIFKGGLEMRF